MPPSPKQKFSGAIDEIPNWASVLIGAVPLFPPLYIVAFFYLHNIKILPLFTRLILFFFIATQLLAATLTPHPVLSLGLATVRLLLILSMVSVGAVLKQPKRIQSLVAGYSVLFISAWTYAITILGPQRILHERLGHPFYYTVSLGLIATISIWLLLEFSPAWYKRWWFWPVAVMTSLTLLATQSRGAILALLAGCLGGVLLGAKRYWFPIVGAAVGTLFLLITRPQTGLLRLLSEDLTGRDQVWQGAILAFQDRPWGGQGPYQAGSFYWFLSGAPCRLTDSLAEAGVPCPTWAERLNGAWLTAHNVILHSLAETGLIGTTGLLALLVLSLCRAFQSHQPFLFVAIIGYLTMSIIDVVTTGPSPHFAELFWVIVGMALTRRDSKAVRSSVIKWAQP